MRKQETITKIREIARALEYVEAIYGMGSYFRGGQYNDIDLVVVVSSAAKIVALGSEIRGALSFLHEAVGAQTDVTVFTTGEFEERPLRDMDTLVPIYSKSAALP